jgi:outer membrane biosynthesis protein TonB
MRRALETLPRFVSIGAILCIPLSFFAQDPPSGTQPTQAPLKVCSAKNPPPCATAPRPTYRPQAEYNDKARKKKISGTVILGTTVGTDGHTHDIHVVQPVGYGLDEQAAPFPLLSR